MRHAPAALGRRIGAYVIDGAVTALVWGLGVGIGWAVGVVAGVPWFIAAGVVVIAWALTYTAMQGGAGSIGMRLLGLRLVRQEGSEPDGARAARSVRRAYEREGLARLGFGKALLRNVVWGLAASVFVGYFSVLFDSTGLGQGWHDKVAGAIMVDVRGVVAGTAAAPGEPPSSSPSSSRTSSSTPSSSSARTLPSTPGAPKHEAPGAPGPDDALIAHVPGITAQREGHRDSAGDRASGGSPGDIRPPIAASPPLARTATPTPATSTPAPATSAPATGDIEATRVTRATRSLALIWDDGTLHTVTSRTLFGRNPAPDAGAVTVSVRDETLSLSKSHFEIDVAAEGSWLVDRHSTNGVTLVRSGTRIACAPGERVALLPGDALEIGDRVATIGGTS